MHPTDDTRMHASASPLPSPPAVPLPVTLDDIEAAARRIAPHVRRTPTLPWSPRFDAPDAALERRELFFKLEHLQVGGSFKARGALNRLLLAAPEELARGVVTASGGNHGIGVAWAAHRLGAPATIFLPDTAPTSSERLLRSMGARTVRGGAAWDDAWARARAESQEHGALAVHPFEDAQVIAGQGTVALELLADAPELDAIIVAIGGGGLIAGMAAAARAQRPELRVVGVEPEGAPSMRVSVEAGRVVTLPSVKTIAGTLAPRAVGPLTLGLTRALVGEIVLVSDEEMRAAMRLCWRELRQLVEPAGAAALAALTSGRATSLAGARRIGVLLCGANLDVDAVLGAS